MISSIIVIINADMISNISDIITYATISAFFSFFYRFFSVPSYFHPQFLCPFRSLLLSPVGINTAFISSYFIRFGTFIPTYV